MFPNYCSVMSLAGWFVMLLLWVGLVSVVVWGIARLFPDHGRGADAPPPPGRGGEDRGGEDRGGEDRGSEDASDRIAGTGRR